MNSIQTKIAATEADFLLSREIILEYVASLKMDLAFQNFNDEINDLKAMYSNPYGGLVLATVDEKLAGIAGIRKFERRDCELKRMFIRPEYRGIGVAKMRLERSLKLAKDLNYDRVLLDTDNSMKAAMKLYLNRGFVEIPAYRFNPHDSARYFQLDL